MTMGDNRIAFSKDLTIQNELGLHARSAAMIAKIAQAAIDRVWIVKGSEKADATSIIDMLTLACVKGTCVKVQIENDADRDILRDIVKLVNNRFGE